MGAEYENCVQISGKNWQWKIHQKRRKIRQVKKKYNDAKTKWQNKVGNGKVDICRNKIMQDVISLSNFFLSVDKKLCQIRRPAAEINKPQGMIENQNQDEQEMKYYRYLSTIMIQ